MVSIVRRQINNEMRAILNPSFSKEGVHKAIEQMHLLKAPGPNDLLALFYQQFWDIIGKEVTQFALEILNNGAKF